LAADIAAMVAERGFHSLKAPIRQVTCPHSPVPFSPVLEDAYIPSPAAIEAAARSLTSAAEMA
jgi:pyruvate dehydrogenase E1 component beta subunit